jgi:predicted restriction endonuclease
MDPFTFASAPRNKGKLLIELVPATMWEDNLRSRFSRSRWDQIRKAVYHRANHVCEVCGESGKDQGRDRAVECHEIWGFNDGKHTQTLIGLIALCPRCHQVKHAGRTIHLDAVNGFSLVLQRLMKVNGWDTTEATQHIHSSFALWHQRSRFDWEIDLSWLDTVAF